jgi:hypothetical protein
MQGVYGTAAGAGTYTNASCAGPCSGPPGRYCPEGSAAASGVQCPAGSFCPSMGAVVPCAVAGRWCPPGCGSVGDALACDAGTYGLAVSYNSSQCAGPCAVDPGNYCPAGSTSSGGVPTPAGTFFKSATVFAPCPAGTHSSVAGAISSAACAPCPINTFARSGAVACSACAPAQYAASSTDVPSAAASVTALVMEMQISDVGVIRMMLQVVWSLRPQSQSHALTHVYVSGSRSPGVRLTVAAPSNNVTVSVSLSSAPYNRADVSASFENCYGVSPNASTWTEGVGTRRAAAACPRKQVGLGLGE